MNNRWIQRAAVVLLCTSLIGCKQNVSLPGIAAMAKTAAASSDALTALPQDFYDSCVRQISWLRGSVLTSPGARAPAGQAQAGLPADVNTKQLQTTLGALPSFSQVVDLFDVQTGCAPSKVTSEQMIAMTAVLTDYFAALGKLASTGTTTGIGIDKLGNAVKGLDPKSDFNKSGKTAAIAGALDQLASALIAGQAKNDIAADVTAANDLVGKLIDRLISDKAGTEDDNAVGYYLKQLRIERFAMHTFYANNIGATKSGLEKLQAFQFYLNEAADDAKIDQRVAATQTYVSALSKLKKSHNDVAKAVNNKDFASLASIAQAYIDEFQPQIDALRKAFK